MTLSARRLELCVLVCLTILIFWNASGESMPGLDATVYGSLAKNILKYGEWSKLHWSSDYFDFYQHPPLAIWLSALLFKLVPPTDVTMKILPFLFSCFTLAGVYFWAKRGSQGNSKSAALPFLTVLVLLTSFRFTKYSVSFMLDPFLAAFMFWAVFLALEAERVSLRLGYLLATLSGVCVAGAALSKGMPALASFGLVLLVPVITLFSNVKRERGPAALRLLCTVVGVTAPLVLWFWLGDGLDYIAHYWSGSVSHRLGGGELSRHFGPLKNLLKIYWPWLPFWVWGLVLVTKKLRRGKWLTQLKDPSFVAALGSFGILVSFMLSGHFLEQHLVPFYPFAALIVAETALPYFSKYMTKLTQVLFWVAIVWAFALATLPVHFHGKRYLEPWRNTLKRAAAECTDAGIKRIGVSPNGVGNWAILGAATWYTAWDARLIQFKESPTKSGSDLALIRDGEARSPAWIATSIGEGDFRLYRVAGVRCGK